MVVELIASTVVLIVCYYQSVTNAARQSGGQVNKMPAYGPEGGQILPGSIHCMVGPQGDWGTTGGVWGGILKLAKYPLRHLQV